MENRFDTHLGEVDEHKDKDVKIRVRFSNRDAVTMNGDCGFTMKLTDEERLELIHILSKFS